jgi:LuxR family transcriptional regulator, maltose regulon positive regulatory protein
MSTPILATKLHIPQLRPKVVHRSRLVVRLNEGLHRKVSLISAPAGSGKTTLVSEWIAESGRSTAWLSLDAEDSDLTRFLSYLIAALQPIAPNVGDGLLNSLQTPLPPPTEVILTTLLNELAVVPGKFILVLDDYHAIESAPVDKVLSFLVEHLPSQMHLVILTRAEPPLPLARLRVRDQLNELRVADLRFTPGETAEFLNQVMELNLSAENIAALESRTEGWVAGLQLAALSMRGAKADAPFIETFTGNHHFVLDYLTEEVLQRQPASVQTFLLHTSILDRFCASLCEAVIPDAELSGQATLEYLERANLFIIPLDAERRWYRYHHLFADLLRQKLFQTAKGNLVTELHLRAAAWFEQNGLGIEAFQHATAANDIEGAERLLEGNLIPRHFRGVITSILAWLESLPATIMDAKPALLIRHASLLLVNGQNTGVGEMLEAAENTLQSSEPDATNRNLIGRIAVARATLALTRYDPVTMLSQARRALDYLSPHELSLQANAYWLLGYASIWQEDFSIAREALVEAIRLGRLANDVFAITLATMALGQVQEAENRLLEAAETYRHVLQLAGDQPLQIISQPHLSLAHILYEWNDLDNSERHARQSLQLAQQYDRQIDRFIVSEIFLARLKLARGDVTGASAMLVQAYETARQKNFAQRLPEIADVQVLVLLRQNKLAEAAQLVQAHDLPMAHARVHLAQGEPTAALPILAALDEKFKAKGSENQRFKLRLLQAVVLYAVGQKATALHLLKDALELTAPQGFVRSFIDEGAPMARLLSEVAPQSDYAAKLLAAFNPQVQSVPAKVTPDMLSQRELEVLNLIGRGLSNQEISQRLFLALDTVKGHNRRIYEKLGVQRRTEAVARARELGLL